MTTRIRLASLFSAAAITFAVVLGGVAIAQSGNSELGTWKLNLAKSKYTQGAPPKSTTTTLQAAGTGVKGIVDAIAADGTVRHWEFTANYDGKDNPITGNSQNGDTIARTRIDANTVKSVYKKGGQATVTQTSVVSSDRKTRTLTSTGTDVFGKPVNSVTLYEKQ